MKVTKIGDEFFIETQDQAGRKFKFDREFILRRISKMSKDERDIDEMCALEYSMLGLLEEAYMQEALMKFLTKSGGPGDSHLLHPGIKNAFACGWMSAKEYLGAAR